MISFSNRKAIRRAAATACALLFALPASFAQAPPPAVPEAQQAAPLLSPDQLDNLVAPIALYPDPLLSQVLAASTYPLEIVEAQQWLTENSNLSGDQLMDAARQQNWDPSVQALVAFPDALRLLASDIRWTTDLGNAFLAQQADVMRAVQDMRARARANGRLATTPQQVVTESGPTTIEILPANPQVIYVPVYQPAYIWGPPVWDSYLDLWYASGYGWGFGFGPAIYMGAFFPSWGGWGGWGWGCGWYGGGLFVNVGFFHRYGFHDGYYGRRWGHGGGRFAWEHNGFHRLGVRYSSRALANRYGYGRYGSSRSGAWMNGRRYSGGARVRSTAGGWRSFGNGSRSSYATRPATRGWARAGSRTYAGSDRQSSRGYSGAYRQPSRGYAANPGSRTYRTPAYRGNRGYGSTPGYRGNRAYGSIPGYRGNRGYGSIPAYGGTPYSGRSISRGYPSSPGRGYSAPRAYSAPRSYSGPRGGYSHSSSGPRFSGGGRSGGYSGFSGGGRSGGHSGFSGGRSGGGGGRGGHRR